MTPLIALDLLTRYGPSAVTLAGKLWALHEAGNKPLTAADFAELDAYAAKTSADFLREAGVDKAAP